MAEYDHKNKPEIRTDEVWRNLLAARTVIWTRLVVELVLDELDTALAFWLMNIQTRRRLVITVLSHQNQMSEGDVP
jgi:hypothetical protein